MRTLLASKIVLIVGGLGVAIISFWITLMVIEPADSIAPAEWTMSYIDAQNQSIAKTVPAPTGDAFIEGNVKGPVRIEMTLSECRAYDRYRFWVGPFGDDTTKRQPLEWTMLVRGTSGDWVRSNSEQIKEGYANNKWYKFPLNHKLSCIRQVQMEIARLVDDGSLFRLFQIEISKSSPIESLIGER